MFGAEIFGPLLALSVAMGMTGATAAGTVSTTQRIVAAYRATLATGPAAAMSHMAGRVS